MPVDQHALRDELVKRYPDELVDELLPQYVAAKRAAYAEDFAKIESSLGLFCEAAIRICTNEVAGSFVPIGDASFGVEKALNACTNSAAGSAHDTFRLLIPNTVKAMYAIRNRRGVDHLSLIKPNHIDARVVTAQADWVVAELYRLAAKVATAEAQATVDHIVEREIPIVERIEGELAILSTTISTEDSILLAKYFEGGPIKQADLVRIVRRAQPTVSLTMKKLVEGRFLHQAKDGAYYLTAKGRARVEALDFFSKLATR